jgi:scyllo-inositol 2-dehydrogenase (NADP+)
MSSRAEARQQIQAQLGVKPFSSFDDVLADPEVDLVVLATPNDLHASQAIEAMAAGKHVVTDKPMCLNVAEADAMLAASRAHGRLLSVFHNRRWDGDMLTIRQVLAQGLIGQLVLVETAWLQPRPPQGWSSERKRGGGKLMDLGVHMIDQVLQLIPAPVTQVYARLYGGIWKNDIEDHAHCVMTLANGIDVHVTTSSVARGHTRRWRLLGTQGTLCKEGFDPQEGAMVAGDIDAAREASAQYARLYRHGTGQTSEQVIATVPGRWRTFYENIADVLQHDAALAVTPESSRAVIAVIDAARRSAAIQQAVPVSAPPA